MRRVLGARNWRADRTARNLAGRRRTRFRLSAAFSAGKPKFLFQGLYQPTPILDANYDVAPDGRFLMLKPSGDEQAPTQVNLVLNWFEELKRLAP